MLPDNMMMMMSDMRKVELSHLFCSFFWLFERADIDFVRIDTCSRQTKRTKNISEKFFATRLPKNKTF